MDTINDVFPEDFDYVAHADELNEISLISEKAKKKAIAFKFRQYYKAQLKFENLKKKIENVATHLGS
jgi:hypothetical protein